MGFPGVRRVVGHVGVDVDQAGEAGEFGEIDDLGAGRNVEGLVVTDLIFSSSIEDDGIGPELAMGVPEFAEFDGFHGFRRGKRLRNRNGGEEKKSDGQKCARDFHGVRSVFWFEVLMNGFSVREAGKQRRRWGTRRQENPRGRSKLRPYKVKEGTHMQVRRVGHPDRE